MVQGELKGVCGETYSEVLIYQHCELVHRNKTLLHLSRRVPLSLSCIELLVGLFVELYLLDKRLNNTITLF